MGWMTWAGKMALRPGIATSMQPQRHLRWGAPYRGFRLTCEPDRPRCPGCDGVLLILDFLTDPHVVQGIHVWAPLEGRAFNGGAWISF